MNLLLVRHAQSMNNHHAGQADYLRRRHPDPPLTGLGHGQARALADWFTRDPWQQRVTHLYSSLMIRAVQTAAPLAETLSLPVHALPDAHECGGINSGPEGNFTPVPGGTHETLREHCPRLVWPADLQGGAWPGGCEPWEHPIFQARARSVAAHLQEAASDAEWMVLVTHHDFAHHLITELLSLPPDPALSLPLSNTGTTHLEIQPGRRVLHWHNRTDHLTPEMLTL